MSNNLNKIAHKLMLSCDEATKLIALKQYRKISFRNRIKLSLHLMACKYCKSFNVFNDRFEESIHKTCSITTSYSNISSKKKSEFKNLINHHLEN